MSVPGAQPKRAVSWIFDVTIMVAGGLVGVVALGDLLFGGHLDMQWTLALLIGAPIAALMSRFPLVLNRSSSGIEVGFDSAVLVFLVCFDGGAGALGIWAVGQALSQLNRTKRTDVRMFNVGLGILSGFVAVAVMQWVGDLGTSTLARAERGRPSAAPPSSWSTTWSPPCRSPWRTGAPSARRAAPEHRAGRPGRLRGHRQPRLPRRRWSHAQLPAWAILLLAVPVFTILVATRALSRGREHRRRLSCAVRRRRRGAGRRVGDRARDVLRDNARAAVASRFADLRARAARCRRRSAPGSAPGGQTMWLVAPAVNRARASVEGDRKALEALATVGEEAFARLSLTDEMGRLARHDALTGAAEPHAVPRPGRAGGDPGPAPGRARWRCCSSTWTASSASTTGSVTPRVTSC